MQLGRLCLTPQEKQQHLAQGLAQGLCLNQWSQTQLTWGPLEDESRSGWAALSILQKRVSSIPKKEHNLSSLPNLYY